MTFDIATRTGVAFGRAGGSPRATTFDFSQAGASEAVRFAKAMRATDRLVERYQPDIAFYEAPIGGPKANQFLIGLAASITGTLAKHGVEVRKANIATVRKHFLGKHLTAKSFPGMSPAKAREAIKQAVIGRCTVLGWEPRTDDEADALAIWDWACASMRLAQAKPVGGLF